MLALTRINGTIALAALILSVLWMIGQYYRDRTIFTSLLFFIPSPVVFILSCYCFVVAIVTKKKASIFTFIAVAIVSGVTVFHVENRFFVNDAAIGKGQRARLVHWNVFRGRLGWDAIEERLQEMNAEIIVLNETTPEFGRYIAKNPYWRDYGYFRAGNFAFLGRGQFWRGRWLEEMKDLRAYLFHWKYQNREYKIIAAHLASNPLTPRDPLLKRLVHHIAAIEPDLVVGDFNAPRRSGKLAPLPAGYMHAYETVGKGWSYSWPVPVPLYAIDQCILGRNIVPVRYRLESTAVSDHRMQTLDFALKD